MVTPELLCCLNKRSRNKSHINNHLKTHIWLKSKFKLVNQSGLNLIWILAQALHFQVLAIKKAYFKIHCHIDNFQK